MSKQTSHRTSEIHITELSFTVSDLINKFPILKSTPFKLIGSSGNGGMKSFMGDVDIAVRADKKEFVEELKNIFDSEDLVLNSGVVSLIYPISNFNENFRPNRKREVQIDFLFGEPEIMQLMYASPDKISGEFRDSPLDGGHRNSLIGTYFSFNPEYVNDYSGSEAMYRTHIRYKWSMTEGLVLIARHMRADYSQSKYVRYKQDTLITKYPPHKNQIISLLFGQSAKDSVLNSAEDFFRAIAKYKGKQTANELLDALNTDRKWSEADITYLKKLYDNEFQITKSDFGKQNVSDKDIVTQE